MLASFGLSSLYDYDADGDFDYHDDANDHYAALSPWVTVNMLNPVSIIFMMLLRMLVMYMVVMAILVMYMMMKLTSPRKMLP